MQGDNQKKIMFPKKSFVVSIKLTRVIVCFFLFKDDDTNSSLLSVSLAKLSFIQKKKKKKHEKGIIFFLPNKGVDKVFMKPLMKPHTMQLFGCYAFDI